MESLVEDITRGNVAEVKVVLASVVAALAVYQLVLIAIGHGKVRPPVPDAPSASMAERFSGDTILARRLPGGSLSVDGDRPKLRQVIASLLVAAAIVAVVVIAVTAELGPTSVAELEAREEARDQRIDALEDLQERIEERRESR